MSCSHLICADVCLERMNLSSAEEGVPQPACKTCGIIPIFMHPEDGEEDDISDPVSQGTRSGKRKNRKAARIEREKFPKNWLDTIGDELLPSTKTIAVKAQIMNWIKENKDIKIIVFTQFLPM